jgi:predicted transcriptional regulator
MWRRVAARDTADGKLAMKKNRTAGDIMIHPVLAVRESWTVRELASYFVEKSISGAPVLDRTGRLSGVVSLTDIVDQVTRERDSASLPKHAWSDRIAPEDLRGLQIEDSDRLVGDIMTPTFFTVPAETTIPKIARTMVAGRIHRILVTAKGRVVGIVTTLDVLRELAGPGPAHRARAPRKAVLGAAAPPARPARAKVR